MGGTQPVLIVECFYELATASYHYWTALVTVLIYR